MTGKGDGTYYVYFKWIPTEKCCLSVTVEGQDIVGSPLEVKQVGFKVVSAEPIARIQGGQCLLLVDKKIIVMNGCLLYTSPSPRDRQKSRMPSSA